MNDVLTTIGSEGVAAPLAPAPLSAERKGIDLAVIKKGAKDYLDFLDATKEVFYAYLYHRTGSIELARTLLSEIYLELLSRAMSLWWFGSLHIGILLDAAEHALKGRGMSAADIDSVYIPTLSWLTPEEKQAVSSMHDALWTLPKTGQKLIILSVLLGLPSDRIAQALGMREAQLTDELKTAVDILCTRWQPPASVRDKLNSLAFVPSLDIRAETQIRFAVVEKYNALRFRRYQWVIVGGLFAVLSNVIVASVLAFAVVVQPPSSLRGVRTEVASLDAVLLRRQAEVDNAKESVAAQFKEAQRIVAFDVSRDFTNLGLAAALESLRKQQDQEEEVDRIIKLMKRAKTAMGPAYLQTIAQAWSMLRRFM